MATKSSRSFELHVYLPTVAFDEGQTLVSWHSTKRGPKALGGILRVQHKMGVWELHPDGWGLSEHSRVLDGRARVTTRIRAWDARSYFMCLMLIKERAFGFINQKNFVFVDTATGEEHELKSEAVKKEVGAAIEVVGNCFRIRSTIRNCKG